MKPRLFVLVLCLVCHQALAQQAPTQIEVHFTGCTAAIVKELDAAKTTIRVQAYDFTSLPIAKALLEAHKRGVDVEVILDKKNRTAKYSSATFLANAGIRTLIDARHKIAHSKIMVIDDQTVITGSFNFTKAAETSNAENLLVIHDKALAAKYVGNWKTHADHSEPYQVKERGYSETQRKQP
jgi:phosphatidylserine/phosphatidylglycerophosphate/cardiolipin synthase-like enzyme